MKLRIRIWDLPTRVFHWTLVFLVVGLFVTGLRGGAAMDWHFRFGIGVLILLVFRVVWGIVGGRWSRFASFVRGPGAVLAYLRSGGANDHAPGHNPLGALSVLGMLAILAIQVVTGLSSNDEISFEGPLAKFLPNARVAQFTAYHKDIGAWIVLALVVLHIAAIAFYRIKRKTDLIGPMVNGDKMLDTQVEASRDTAITRLLALVLLVLAGGLGWWVWKL